MTRKVFLCIGSVVLRPYGGLASNGDLGVQDHDFIPIVKANSAATDYASRSMRIDLAKQIDWKMSNFATAQLDGWGVTSTGKDLAAPGIGSAPDKALALTTVGGHFPTGRHWGRIYVETAYLAQNYEAIVANGDFPVDGFRDREVSLISIAYDDGARYLGFPIKPISVDGPIVTAVVYRRQASPTPIAQIVYDTSARECDMNPVKIGFKTSGGTSYDLDVAPFRPGNAIDPDRFYAVFLSFERVLELANRQGLTGMLAGPKLPFWLGG
jgi:hypothetical protein